MTVEIEVGQGVATDDAQLLQIIKSRIKNTTGLSMNIDLKVSGSIPRSQGGMLSRILDKRN